MYIKRKAQDEVPIYIGESYKLPGSSVLYYQAQNYGFWAILKSQVKVSEALSLSNLALMAKRDFF